MPRDRDSTAVETGQHGQVILDRGRVWRVLAGLTIGLVVVGTAAAVALLGDVPFAVDSVGRLLLLNEEANVASWWASTLLILCSGGFVLASGVVSDMQWRLRALAVLMLALSMDETAIIHERATGALLLLFTGDNEGDQPLWVVVAIPLVLLTVWFVLPLLRTLPAAVRRRWWIAAGLYVGGAIGVEVLVNVFTDPDGVLFQFGIALEEGMEYAGPIVLLDSLLLLTSGGQHVELRWPRSNA